MERYLTNFKNCLQKEIPYCSAECPFHLDILDFIEKMKRGGFQAAFKTYRNAVGFPLIVSNLCQEPCKEVCPRKDTDAAVGLALLEKACINYTENKASTDYNLPSKKKRVAVIGAGPSGLACALRLCMKKYEVEIFEAKDRIGGCLWELMEPDLFLTDIREQFKHENYIVHYNALVRSAEELGEQNFDAVYVATGKGGNDYGLIAAAEKNNGQYCAEIGTAGWFAGGGVTGDELVYALAAGLYAGTVIDNYLKTKKLAYPENTLKTSMCLDQSKVTYEAPVASPQKEEFSREEALKEASRCIECQCDFCRTYCDLTDFYHKWPLRIRDEIMATTLPGWADVKATPAKRLLSTCNQCGLCKETCPENIDLGGLILAGRQSMHRQKKAPWVFHDFWLRDMDFANGKTASICKMPPASQNSRFTFFPGCQLGAGDPELVEKAYAYLLSKRKDVGLLLRCCGAPAEWSGDEEKHLAEISAIHSSWQELGKPTMILACPTCMKKFKTHLPEIPVVSLYEIITEWGLNSDIDCDTEDFSPFIQNGTETYSVFDPCAARQEEEMKKAVRTLAARQGLALEPLPENDLYARCCGYGGQPGIANPDYQNFVVQKRITENDHPYITYCINCRDVFAEAGKKAIHILDLVFGSGKAPGKLETVSERRENRVTLKRSLLKKFWNEETENAGTEKRLTVRISSELSWKLHQAKMLEEDAAYVIDYCEHMGRRVQHPDTGTYSGYCQVGFMTYWTEYRKLSETGSFELVNAYAHRMKIELEPVWNGRKTEVER